MKTKLLSLILVTFLALSFVGTKESYSETRSVLLEFCTGTWCPWCPCGDYTAEQLLLAHPNMIVLAYHGPHLYGGDPFTDFNGYSIISTLTFAAYPTGIVDRTNSPNNPYYDYTMWTNGVNNEYNSNPNTVFNVHVTANSYNSSTRVLTSTISSTALQNLTDQYMINCILTEDGVVYPQSSNNVCIPGGSSYVHKWIVRNMVNGVTGQNVNSGTWNQNQTITTNVNTTLDNAWIDVNCNLVVFVYKSSSPLYLANVQQATTQSVTSPLGIKGISEIPKNYTLSQNYPNPFNPTTNIKFSIAKDGNVSLKIYDITGAVVQTYVDGFMRAGSYNAEVDASNLASGVYFYTLKTSDFMQTKKMILVK
jgi:hypothetical protein